MTDLLVIPIKTRIITAEDDMLDVLIEAISNAGEEIQDNDILAMAETPLGTTEGQVVKLSEVEVSPMAQGLADRYDLLPAVAELVIQEADEILGGISHVLLTIKNNTLMANAGVDKSNIPPGYASLLPVNPKASAMRIRREIKKRLGKTVGVLIIDSRTQPLRLGNIGMALGVAGFKPVADDRGRNDLFGNTLRITRRAVADNLSSACTAVMGESDESIPAALIRDAPVEFVDASFDSGEMWIGPDECMYMAIFEQWRSGKTQV
ncbi:MAG: coenzyme F420-0:L-glutamate ligase [Candidatus Thorarchaeota archaeon]|jgi:coenzyme F420-0:L-glutamate ligase|nr:coenzyme F420-0:L-glutamate ligase [Candidatus Thorarchaeota archaeon]